MKKLLLITTLIFAVFVNGFAQTPNNSDWKTFAPAGEEFSAEVPALLLSKKPGQYRVIFEGIYFFIFSDSLKDLYQTKKVLEFAGENQTKGNVQAVGNFVGEKFGFIDSEGFYQTILIVKTKARSYVFQTVSETENNPAVERFFASLDFIKELPEESTPSESEVVLNSSENKGNKSFESGNGAGGGSGKGNGTGNGIGNGSKNSDSVNLNKRTTTFQIISKPGVAYTDLARFYNLSGVVQLRITFLPSGEIGTITAIKKLPFGLTNNAINAARRIQFVPPTKEGIPYSETKVVEYGFTIF